MRVLLSLALAALLVFALAPAAAHAQRGFPPGPYQRDCRDIRIDGNMLSAFCRGSQGSGQSSLNVLSCASEIYVDAQGGLICQGPGAGRSPPGGYPPPRPSPPDGGYYPGPGGGGPRGRWSATLYEGPGYRGRSVTVYGDTENLNRSGLNDRVGSIRFARRSGPWLVCTDARFGGRCTTVRDDVRDTGRIGMQSSISSLRPLR
jgi:hypothetical protein